MNFVCGTAWHQGFSNFLVQLKTLGTCLHQCEKLLSHMKGEVEKANDRGHEEEKKRVEEEKQRQAELEKLKKEQEERARQMQQPVQVDLTSKGGKGKAGAPSQGGGDSLSLGGMMCFMVLVNLGCALKVVANKDF